MRNCKCINCEKGQKVLKKTVEFHASRLRRLDSSNLAADEAWAKSDFRPVINSLHHALKTYSCEGEIVGKMTKRVKSFKWRMFFMSDEAVEEEAHALAHELETFLES